MAELKVTPAYVMGPTDILTVDKFNLMGTPIVDLSLADRVDDQNFFRNGNFYSAFWLTPAGLNCPMGVDTINADYWTINPSGGSVNCLRTTQVPDLNSLFGMEIQGNAGTTDVRVSQPINGDLSATMRRMVTFSGYLYNGAGLGISPKLEIWTADIFNGGSFTIRQTEDLQTCAPGLWTYVSVGFDLTAVTNVANGLRFTVLLPSGGLSAPTKYLVFSRIKVQIGELATEFVDDAALFITTPSIDATMLQDGCIARPELFAPSVIPAGAYMPKSIHNSDVADGAIDGRTMVQDVSTTLSAGFTQPAISSTVSITVGATAGFLAGEPISIDVGGIYTVSSVTDTTHLAVINTGIIGNAVPATAIPTAGNVYQASAVVENLGYVPIDKSGDDNIGPGPLIFENDTVVGNTSYETAAAIIQGSTGHAANDGYMPAISFNRPGNVGRVIGLDINGRFKTANSAGTIGYLLDSQFGVDNGSYQYQSITYDKLAQSLINLVCPVGMIMAMAGNSYPPGWGICNGQAVSRTGYPDLFAVIGTYWGGGDGVTTFNLPNLLNRTLVGAGSFYGLGQIGGETTHQLTVAELASHGHAVANHNHSFVGPNAGGAWGGGSGWGPAAGITGDAALSIQATGSNTPHNNMQPFAGILYFIKTIL